jgi:hypothetical protein
MKIQIEEKLFIESDDMQFIVKRYSGNFDKNDKETYKVLGYFGSLKQAVKFLIKKDCMASTVTTFQQMFVELERIEDKYDKLIGI